MVARGDWGRKVGSYEARYLMVRYCEEIWVLNALNGRSIRISLTSGGFPTSLNFTKVAFWKMWEQILQAQGFMR